MSSGVTFTSSAALALTPARASSLAPLVTATSGSEAAATTSPPGHMQNENTLRSRRDALRAVGRRAERRIIGGGAVLGAVDEALRVLDAHTHSEGLALELESAVLE